VAFPQVPAWRFHGAGSRASLKGHAGKGQEGGHGKGDTEGLEEKGSEDVRSKLHPEEGGCGTTECVAAKRTQAGEGGEGHSACRPLGTWPAMSDGGRKTPESTSAGERVATQRPLCSSAPHPFLLLPFQFIYPSSKDSLTVPRGWLKWPRGGL